jgi:hypothetical protein
MVQRKLYISESPHQGSRGRRTRESHSVQVVPASSMVTSGVI